MWADELLRRDIDQVIDVHASDRVSRPDRATRVLMIDWPYLPWVPKELHMIPKPTHLKQVEPKEAAKANRKSAYPTGHGPCA